MRHFEQVVLVGDDGKTIIERRYNTGEVEYWSVMNVTFTDGQRQGSAQVPFRIELPDSYRTPEGHRIDPVAERAAAFERFDAALKAAEPAAHESVKGKIEEQARRQRSAILLAGALPPMPLQ